MHGHMNVKIAYECQPSERDTHVCCTTFCKELLYHISRKLTVVFIADIRSQPDGRKYGEKEMVLTKHVPLLLGSKRLITY